MTNEGQLFVVPDSDDYGRELLRTIQAQKVFIESSPSKASDMMNIFLGFHLSVLGLEPKERPDLPSSRLANSICLVNLKTSSLKPITSLECKLASLDLLALLVRSVKKSRVFAFWYTFLPGCAFSPCKKGIFELINHPSHEIKEKTLDLMVQTFQNSSTHLQLANAHCKSGSFTPVCLDFALALARMVRCASVCLDEALHDNIPFQVCHASKALVVFYEHVPFHRLENGLLTEVMEKLLPGNLRLSANPVIQIAILQLFAVFESISPPHPEVVAKFNELFKWFYSLTFPEYELFVDNNIRYVSINNLGLLASLETEEFLGKVNMLQPSIESVLRSEKDQSVVIHALRLIKTIGKCGNALMETNPGLLESENRLLHFWLGILKSSLIDSIEARECPILKAALCNCIAEVGGKVFCSLPTDRRLLAITFMLRLCKDSDHRTVTSATRGIGMMVFLPTLQNDIAFLNDSAAIIQSLLSPKDAKSAHQSVVTSCTWALANLSDSLAKHHLQRASSCDGDHLAGLDDIFPPHIVLELIRTSVSFSLASHSHMNIRSNSVRALGSLLQCLDAMTKWIQLGDFKEVGDMFKNAVNAIVINVSSGKVMKVRWNACYAAGGILKTRHLLPSNDELRKSLVKALVGALESCPNYKVRINSSLALTCVSDRDSFGDEFCPTTCAVVRSLESAVTNVDDVEEVQHRTDLIDQLCATYACLLSIATSKDISILSEKLVEYAELLKDTIRSVLLRISPEKTTVFVEAKRHLASDKIMSLSPKRTAEIFPSNLVETILSVN